MAAATVFLPSSVCSDVLQLFKSGSAPIGTQRDARETSHSKRERGGGAAAGASTHLRIVCGRGLARHPRVVLSGFDAAKGEADLRDSTKSNLSRFCLSGCFPGADKLEADLDELIQLIRADKDFGLESHRPSGDGLRWSPLPNKAK